LMLAASRGTDRMVTWLVKSGADVRLADRQGNTALLYAMKPANAASRAVIEVLLKAGADPHQANAIGETAASLAEVLGIKDEVRLLVRERAAEGGGR
jgi:serine/threonine-protein phosphatase 6 regulatory ankyrin repeat subunit B